VTVRVVPSSRPMHVAWMSMQGTMGIDGIGGRLLAVVLLE